jgi:hypothetical protein
MLVNVGLHVDDPQFLQREKEEREGGGREGGRT